MSNDMEAYKGVKSAKKSITTPTNLGSGYQADCELEDASDTMQYPP
jgi:hypothetical protein